MPNTRKFSELILYVAKRSEDDPNFGATKLNKILFYADFMAFYQLGASISGQTYQKLKNGPAPRFLLPTVSTLKVKEACAEQVRDSYGYRQRRLIALREPDLSLFSGQEVGIINEVIDALWHYNATEVSALSHRFAGWRLAKLGDDIPYEAAFLAEPRELSQPEIIHGQKLQRALNAA